MIRVLSHIIAGVYLWSSTVRAAPPTWATQDTARLSGKSLTLTCSGEAPSLDLARKDALRSCTSSATQYIQTGSLKVRSLSVETEQDGGFHSEISESKQVTGLACKPLREATEELDSGVRIWVQCRYDLGLARFEAPAKDDDEPKPVTSSKELVQDPTSLGIRNRNSSELKRGRRISSDVKVLTISSVPPCSSILVRSSKPRVVRCKQNPISFQIQPGDTELIVRASRKGYLPKHIKITPNLEDDPSIAVILEEEEP